MNRPLLTDLWQRIRLAYGVLTAPRPLAVAPVGLPLVYDPVTRRLVITGDFEIHATGNLFLSSDQHVVVQSGNEGGEYTHHVHLNPDLEEENAIRIEGREPGSPGQPDLQSHDGAKYLDAPADHGDDACSCSDTNAG